jgi:DNA-binding GntR family transcriptional regulator
VARVHEQIAQAIIEGQASVAQAMMNDHLQDYRAQATAKYAVLLNETVTW